MSAAAAMSKVVLADADILFRSALACVLADQGYTVVGQAMSVSELRQQIQQTGPELLIASSDLTGGAAMGRTRPGPGRPALLVLGPDQEHARLVAALDSGAQGYLSKGSSLPDLLAAVAAVLRGEAVVPPEMLGGLLHDLVQQRRSQTATGLTPLSAREQEVLELLAQGQAQEGIARALVISPQTARTHIQKVIGKLGAHSRVEAVAVAVEHGLVVAS